MNESNESKDINWDPKMLSSLKSYSKLFGVTWIHTIWTAKKISFLNCENKLMCLHPYILSKLLTSFMFRQIESHTEISKNTIYFKSEPIFFFIVFNLCTSPLIAFIPPSDDIKRAQWKDGRQNTIANALTIHIYHVDVHIDISYGSIMT